MLDHGDDLIDCVTRRINANGIVSTGERRSFTLGIKRVTTLDIGERLLDLGLDYGCGDERAHADRRSKIP